MKILLVQPRDGKLTVFGLPFRPLTLEMLAACVAPHACDIYDMRVDDTPLAQKLGEFRPDIVGITCPFTPTVPTVIALTSEIRAACPTALIVVGGVHPSLLPDDFRDAEVDVVVHGPGERVLPAIAAAVEAHAPLAACRSISVRTERGLVYTGDSDAPFDLSDFRLPARHLTRKYNEKYLRSPKGQTMALTVASRGCPHRCSFCAAWKVQGGRYLVRDPGSILEEIRGIEEDLVYFFDDNALGNPAVMGDLASRLRAEGIRKEYQMWASSDAIAGNPDLVRLWAGVGLARVFVGFESCSDEQLRRYAKKATVATNEEAHRILAEHNVQLSPTFIVRHDYTAADFDRLHEYLVARDFLMPYSLIYTPLPGTGLWKTHQAELITRDYERFDLYHLTMQPRHMTPREFMTRFTDLYLKNPSWQRVAERLPVCRGMLRGLTNLRELY